MPSALDRNDLAPPRDVGVIRSLGLALLVHAALIAALTWGVSWKRTDPTAAFEAELWANTPQEAAPKLVAALPPPRRPTQPAPKVQAPPTPAPTPNVDIALAQEKKRKALAQQAQDVQSAKMEKELKLKQDQAKLKLAAEAKQAESKKQLQQNQAKADTDAQEAQRQQNIARALGLAGAAGAEAAKGTAQKSSGPNLASSSYGGKVKAKVKPNIVFTENISGNPSAEVEVRTALDGTIISQRLVKSSGNKAWDDAVVKAIIRTEIMPRDADGRVPTPMIIAFTPKD